MTSSPYGNGKMTLFIVPDDPYDLSPAIRFNENCEYCFCSQTAYLALEVLLDAYAGNNLNVITTMPRGNINGMPDDSSLNMDDSNSVTPVADPKELVAAQNLSRRRRQRTLSRLAASNFTRWHQLYGYDRATAQHERDEILKYLSENAVDEPEYRVKLLETHYDKQNSHDLGAMPEEFNSIIARQFLNNSSAAPASPPPSEADNPPELPPSSPTQSARNPTPRSDSPSQNRNKEIEHLIK